MNRKAKATEAALAACPVITDPSSVAMVANKDAQDLAGAVRDLDPREVWGTLALRARDEPIRLIASCVALAAMVPVDKRPSELLAWTNYLHLEEVA